MRTWLISIGLVLVAVGLLWPLLAKLGLGRLPGDIVVERGSFSFYFPIVTCLVVASCYPSSSGCSTVDRAPDAPSYIFWVRLVPGGVIRRLNWTILLIVPFVMKDARLGITPPPLLVRRLDRDTKRDVHIRVCSA